MNLGIGQRRRARCRARQPRALGRSDRRDAGVPAPGAWRARGGPRRRSSAHAGVEAADASWTCEPGVACTVLVSDCLPVLLAAPQARAVGAAHAGWRGLSAGVVEHCARAVCDAASCEPHELVAWLGPCIGPDAFEVGADVLMAFGVEPPAASRERFRYQPRADGDPRWRADLAGLARDRLAALGVRRVSGGTWCTVQDRSRFFSFRRDGVTGRMAAAVWIRADARRAPAAPRRRQRDGEHQASGASPSTSVTMRRAACRSAPSPARVRTPRRRIPTRWKRSAFCNVDRTIA